MPCVFFELLFRAVQIVSIYVCLCACCELFQALKTNNTYKFIFLQSRSLLLLKVFIFFFLRKKILRRRRCCRCCRHQRLFEKCFFFNRVEKRNREAVYLGFIVLLRKRGRERKRRKGESLYTISITCLLLLSNIHLLPFLLSYFFLLYFLLLDGLLFLSLLFFFQDCVISILIENNNNNNNLYQVVYICVCVCCFSNKTKST